MITHHGDLAIINGYFPNGQRDHARVPYKLSFYKAVLDKAKALAAEGHQIIITGDLNTAFAAIDLARPKQNTKTSGCLPNEREALGAFYEAGFVDAFRTLQPDTEGVYSWWSNRSGARGRNIGWRIDYHLVSAALLDRTKAARIHTEVMGSDHCPIELELIDGGAA